MQIKVFGTILTAVVAVLAVSSAAQSNLSQQIWVGVLPAFDSSGEPQAEIFGQYLTSMIFHELQSTSLAPVLLNPGGLYNPLSQHWVREYSGTIGVDVVLITSIMPSAKPKKGDWTLNTQTQVLNVQTGNISQPLTSSYHIDRKHVVSDPYTSRRDAPGDYLHAAYETGSRVAFDPRPFEKQPLGKAAKSMAADIREQILSIAPGLASSKSAPAMPSKSGPCEISFQAHYGKNKRSTAYDLAINEREESITMVEGIARLNLSSGPVLVRLSLHDAPYRLPVQRLYLASTYLDCSRAERNLSLEIGPTGEAVLTWQ